MHDVCYPYSHRNASYTEVNKYPHTRRKLPRPNRKEQTRSMMNDPQISAANICSTVLRN